MVVLTFLLAKAAYERYNSGSGSEVEVEINKRAKDTRAGGRRACDRYNNNRATNEGRNSDCAREYPLRKLSSRPLRGEPSFQREIKVRRSRSDLGGGKSASKSAGRDNKRTATRRNFDSREGLHEKLKALSMSSTECATVPTVRGCFRIDPKAKLLLLPPESRHRKPSDSDDGESPHPPALPSSASGSGADASIREARSNYSIRTELASASEDGVEGGAKEGGFPLSGAEMALAMMGETPAEQTSTAESSSESSGEEVSHSTLRSDVRNEWVDAVFGRDFFPLPDEDRSGGGEALVPLTRDIGVKQGVGLADVPHYVTYGAVLDPGTAASAAAGSNKNRRQTPTTGGKRATDGRTPGRKILQSKTQSTPIIFSSPSSSSLLGGGTLLASASLTSITPSACGLGGGGEGDGGPFRTPSEANRDAGNFARYTVESTPPPVTPFGGRKYLNGGNNQRPQPKLGITISRIPLGLYVHSISLDSEAYGAGISPGSILVDINGMGMLGERSDRALERLWTYAGLFGGEGGGRDVEDVAAPAGGLDESRHGRHGSSSNNNSSGNAAASNNNGVIVGDPDLRVKKPLLLRLYKSSRVYTALLLSGSPLDGIGWAPCGNFALVHKVAAGSIAAEAGVRRGTLVVGVNEEGLRELDHGGVAGRLKERFLRGESITVSMGYTPAASRSGYHEREEKNTGSSSSNQTLDGTTTPEVRSNNSTNAIRDVEVRSKPVEYSSAVVETFFACTGPGAMGMVDDGGFGSGSAVGGARAPSPSKQLSSSTTAAGGDNSNHHPTALGLSEAAAYVAAGGILPPGGILATVSNATSSNNNNNIGGRRPQSDGRDPKANPGAGRFFAPCPALPPERLFEPECWNSLSSLARSMAYHAAGSCETTYLQEGGPFERLASTAEGGEAPHSQMECMDLIEGIANKTAAPISLSSKEEEAGGTSALVLPVAAAEEVFDAHLLQLLGVAISPMMARVERGQRLSETLMDIVINVALNDINLCQRLFFLLRSFIGEFEEQKVPHGHISEESALAMRLCRYAQRRLSGRMFDKSACREKERHCSEGYPINRESTSTSRMRTSQQDYSHLTISASESSIGNAGTAITRVSDDGGEHYPSQVPNVSSPSSSADDDAERPVPLQERPTSPSLVESLSEDVPASHGSSSRENHDQNSAMLEHSNINSNDPSNPMPKKKSKSKKILSLLKGSGKSMRSFKRTSSTLSDHGSTFAPSTSDSGVSGALSTHSNKKSPKNSICKPSFSFPYVFHKQPSTAATVLQTIDCTPPRSLVEGSGADESDPLSSISLSRKFENMAWILRQLDNSCSTIEKNLMKTFSQKMADWALYPWSASKESALASVTQSFRSELRHMNSPIGGGAASGSESSETRFPILNPVDPTELLTSVDADECFILPSAHFPLLLCFNSERRVGWTKKSKAVSPRSKNRYPHSDVGGEGSNSGGDTLYRVRVEIMSLRSTMLPQKAKEAFVIQGTVAGMIDESGVSDASRRSNDCAAYRWTTNNTLVFETRSNWGCPKALSLKVSSLLKYIDDPDETESHHDQVEVGCGFVDLCPIWKEQESSKVGVISSVDSKTKIYLFDSAEEFDQHGQAVESSAPREDGLELHLRVSAEVVSIEEQPKKRLLLYKHGDDLRQELLAIQFIERCNQILLASGLDLKLKTFSCQPVGSKTGFIEWVRGTVPLSELCKSSGGSSHPGSNVGVDSRQSSRSKEGLAESETLGHFATAQEELLNIQADCVPSQSHRWFKDQSLPGLRQKMNGSVVENPIQDFLRSAAFDETAPYLVKKDVMATYVKSCAGYCVITYLLGVGDRHLDNILLHQNGHLLHCDYSFILGQDPKTYLPMRITEEMIKGFGGRESDNFAKFLFFTGAAFLTLRRHNNLHSLLSHICNMIHANMGDVSINQPPEEAILAMRGRFRLDLNDSDALAYIEDVVEKSITSKMWRAVDVMHSLGKHF